MWSGIWERLNNDIQIYVEMYREKGVLCFLFVAAVYGIFLFQYRVKKKKKWSVKLFFETIWKMMVAGLLGVYIYILLYIVFFSRTPGPEVKNMEFLGTYRGSWCMIYFVENAIMLLPWGFLMPRLFFVFEKWWVCIGSGILLSAGIEVIQYTTRLGYMELDDLWTNTLGCIIGYLLSQIIFLFFREKRKESA